MPETYQRPSFLDKQRAEVQARPYVLSHGDVQIKVWLLPLDAVRQYQLIDKRQELVRKYLTGDAESAPVRHPILMDGEEISETLLHNVASAIVQTHHLEQGAVYSDVELIAMALADEGTPLWIQYLSALQQVTVEAQRKN